MTAPTAAAYANFVLALGQASINFSSDSFGLALFTSAYTPNIDTDTNLADLAGEASGTGYARAALASVGWSVITDTTVTPNVRRGVMAAASVTFSSITLTDVLYAVIYKDTGSDATRRLVGYINFGDPKAFSAEDFQVNFSSGVVRIRL